MTNTRRGVLYVGVTSDLASRATQHRDGATQGFTRRYGCRNLVWFEIHTDIEAAIRREKLIKRWRRLWKFELVEARNPEWIDLLPALLGETEFPWPEPAAVPGFDGPRSSLRYARDDKPF
ncbi:GIY-YIG nuclease family protein [Caulobacter sp. DWR1-3-2b1]|uniref:GIY-YIG nuclease family protein n=1 Tax=Caulobacter sp. DWR1-3-2b1 TaxID=2804670 RepID=UPI003CF416D8